MAKPKYKSRATRAAEQADEWRHIKDNLEDLQSQWDDAQQEITDSKLLDALAADLLKEANSNIENITTGEVESLAEEMRSWADNYPENLQGSDKYSAIDEAASTLEGIEPSFDKCETMEDLASVVEELDRAIDELESVEFPGMFG